MKKSVLAYVCFTAILACASPVALFASEEDVQKYLELATNGKSKELQLPTSTLMQKDVRAAKTARLY